MTEHEKIQAMREWALSRIRQCRRDEDRMSLGDSLAASAERRALESVLDQIGRSCRHSYEAGAVYLSAANRPLVRCVICLRPADEQPHLWREEGRLT